MSEPMDESEFAECLAAACRQHGLASEQIDAGPKFPGGVVVRVWRPHAPAVRTPIAVSASERLSLSDEALATLLAKRIVVAHKVLEHMDELLAEANP